MDRYYKKIFGLDDEAAQHLHMLEMDLLPNEECIDGTISVISDSLDKVLELCECGYYDELEGWAKAGGGFYSRAEGRFEGERIANRLKRALYCLRRDRDIYYGEDFDIGALQLSDDELREFPQEEVEDQDEEVSPLCPFCGPFLCYNCNL